jgi:hypothetical protein
MTDTKFTPGPWRLGYGHTVVADSTEGLTIRGSTEPEYYGGNMIAESVASANCHLISAAPELYEALRNIVESGEIPYCQTSPLVVAAKTALSKAKGDTE